MPAFPAWVDVQLSDARLRRLFGQVWAALPATDVARIGAALGEGGALLVTDHNPANRPSKGFGQIARVYAGLRLFVDFFNLADASPALVRFILAHELAHAACGHLPAPHNEFELSPAALLEVMRRVGPPPVTATYTADDVPAEDEANALAARWGFPMPTPARRQGKANLTRYSEWTTRR